LLTQEGKVLNSEPLVAFVPATDLDRARWFYAGVLGLPLAEQTAFACVFQSGGVQLRVTKADSFQPQPFTVLGWTVSDIRAIVSALAGQGVGAERYQGMSQDEDGVWTTPGGDQVAWFKDPDGNVLSLTQPSTASSSS
jgi:catechol 2,3-dioxygenase-like lactoylglutathione lyase family enzyme